MSRRLIRNMHNGGDNDVRRRTQQDPQRPEPRRFPQQFPQRPAPQRRRAWELSSDSSDDDYTPPQRVSRVSTQRLAPEPRRLEPEPRRWEPDTRVVPYRESETRVTPFRYSTVDDRERELEYMLADRHDQRRYEASREMRMYRDRNDQRRYDYAVEQLRNLDRITDARARAFEAANEARRQREADRYEREQQDDARIREMRHYRRQDATIRKDIILDEFGVSPDLDQIYISERHRESYMTVNPNYQWSQLFIGVRRLDTPHGHIRITFTNGERYDVRTEGMYYKVERKGEMAVVRFFRLIGGEPDRSWWSPSTWYEECIEDRNCGVA